MPQWVELIVSVRRTAEGLQARANVGRDGDKPEAEGAEPLAEWEQDLLAGATAGTEAGAAPAETTTETTEG